MNNEFEAEAMLLLSSGCLESAKVAIEIMNGTGQKVPIHRFRTWLRSKSKIDVKIALRLMLNDRLAGITYNTKNWSSWELYQNAKLYVNERYCFYDLHIESINIFNGLQ